MHLNILAFDLDGTLAQHGVVANETWTALRSARRAGFMLLLVTGRRMNDLPAIGPFDELCTAIVAEDGAAIRFPPNDKILLPFGYLALEVLNRLEAAEIPLEKGIAIAATWLPHDKTVLRIISDTGGAAAIEYNKEAVMVLPPGATKGTGLLAALNELGQSAHNVIACGDAENDRSMFEQAELSVAVANASSGIRELADVVLPEPDGAGVRLLIEDLLKGHIPKHEPRPRRLLTVGYQPDKTPVRFSPLMLLEENLAIMGASGTGKSWIAGLLAEKLLQLEYQVCIIDPEGDYHSIRKFTHILSLGGPGKALPPVSTIVDLIEHSHSSLVLNLSAYALSETIPYVAELMAALLDLRRRTGRPHWFLIDEIQSFCRDRNCPLTPLMIDHMKEGGFTLVGYRPSLVDSSVLKGVNHWWLTRMGLPEELTAIEKLLGEHSCNEQLRSKLASLSDKQAFLCTGNKYLTTDLYSGVIEWEYSQRTLPHVRHLSKYLEAQLPASQQFYFHDADGKRAANLLEFRDLLPHLSIQTLVYHLNKGDFRRWLVTILHDTELAKRLDRIAHQELEGEELRSALRKVVSSRFEELKTLT